MSERGDFLSRWSRRKRAEPADLDAPKPVPVSAPALPDEERSDEDVLADLGLKHPSELTAGDDFAAFLRAEVPQHLKKLALRRLWRSDPTLACLDGLNDYDGDFTGTGVGEGGLRTAYRVGRGFVSALESVAGNARPDDSGTPEPLSTARPLEDEQELTEIDAAGHDVDETLAEPDSALGTATDVAESEPASGPTRRRMAFRPVPGRSTEA